MIRNISKGPATLRRLASLIGIIALAAIITLDLAGCPTEDDSGGGGDNGNNSSGITVVTGAQIYTVTRGSPPTFTPYAGTGTVQDVTGEINGNDIGKIGTISADGKLTLNLPATVGDDKLWDGSAYYDIAGLKRGEMTITPDLYLVPDPIPSGMYSKPVYRYFNKPTGSGIYDFKQGWNYTGGSGLITSFNGYNWVIEVE